MGGGRVIGKAILVSTPSTRATEEILSRNSFLRCLIPVVDCIFTIEIYRVRNLSIYGGTCYNIDVHLRHDPSAGKERNRARGVRYSCTVDVVIGRSD